MSMLISDHIETGIHCGHSRAYKHTDSPGPEKIEKDILDCIMIEFDENFLFDDDLKDYRRLRRLIAKSLKVGMMHSYKHTDDPSVDTIVHHCSNDIMNELSEKVKM
jgi:hypothetical protein